MASSTTKTQPQPQRQTPQTRQTQQPRRDAERLYEALSDLVRVYQFRDRDTICCHDISVTQCYALEALVRSGPRTLNELASELYLDKSTASRVVSTLERKGYITRQTHPQDRRAILIDLTSSGKKLCGTIQAELIEDTRKLLADFEPAVREAAPRLLDRLARAAESRLARSSCATGPAAAGSNGSPGCC
jgi:MarR family transcriptional regulator, 2-MHQ and catechol-resistance regulon repressor